MSDCLSLPLQGMRVLDLSYVFAVPYMAGLMSDLGAEVIKIEGPHKLDQTRGRAFGPYLDNQTGQDPWNRSGIFHVLNRGKKSMVLDMGTEQGRDIFRNLVLKSDFVLENFTPRVMRKWGFHYDELKKIKPSIIMLSNTGYGASGPWSSFPSQGTTLEATMGITYYTGYRGDKPWKVGQSYPDFLACWTGLNAVFAALAHRRKTGLGQWVDLGMYQVGAALVPQAILNEQIHGPAMERMGNEDTQHVPSNLYRAAGPDQWLALTVTDDEQWVSLTKLMGQPELAQDERMRSASARRKHRDEVNAVLTRWVLGHDAMELTHALQSLGIAAGPVMHCRDLLLDEHLKARGFYEIVQHGDPIGPRPIISRPYRLKYRDAHIRKRAPRFGEDNQAIMRDLLSMSPEQIQAAYAAGAVQDAPTQPGRSGTTDIEQGLRLGTLTLVDPDYKSRLGIDQAVQEVPEQDER